jgi:hypothetical protein
MILRANLPKLHEVGGRSARVLDAGGWYRPFNQRRVVLGIGSNVAKAPEPAIVLAGQGAG